MTITGQQYRKGCRRAAGLDGVDGGVIPLGSHWMVNHYSNQKERFLGWLVIPPIKHHMRMSELTIEELKEFGIMAQRLEDALFSTYNASHVNNKIEIVHLVRLGRVNARRRSRVASSLAPRAPNLVNETQV